MGDGAAPETPHEDLRDAFRHHLRIGSVRAAYDHLLATTRLHAEFDDTDPKLKVVSLRADDGRIPYRLRLGRWGLMLDICEPAHATWAQLDEAPVYHFWPRFARPSEEEDDEHADPDDHHGALRIMNVSDAADFIDFSRHTEYPLAD